MQRIFNARVERITSLASDDSFGEGVAQAPATSLFRDVFLHVHDAVQRIVDAVITRAAAEISLQHARQILQGLFIEGSGSHDHAGGAEAALERLRIQEGLLHRVKLTVLRQPLDGRDCAPLGAIGRHQTTVKRRAVEPDGAGAAIALIAALLHAEPAVVPQERSQALAGRRLGRELLAVDREVHRVASSARISSA